MSFKNKTSKSKFKRLLSNYLPLFTGSDSKESKKYILAVTICQQRSIKDAYIGTHN